MSRLRIAITVLMASLAVAACTPKLSHATWKIALGSMKADAAQLESLLYQNGYVRQAGGVDCPRAPEGVKVCAARYTRDFHTFVSVAVKYTASDDWFEVAFTEQSDRFGGGFSRIGEQQLVDFLLNREFGSRLKLIHPRNLPS